MSSYNENVVRQHMIAMQGYIYRFDIPLTLQRLLSCMSDDIINFISNSIQIAHDHNITQDEIDKEYEKHWGAVDEKIKELVNQSVRMYDKICKKPDTRLPDELPEDFTATERLAWEHGAMSEAMREKFLKDKK